MSNDESPVQLIPGRSDDWARAMLAKHLVIRDAANMAPRFVDPNNLQFPTLGLLRCSEELAKLILTQHQTAHAKGRLVIAGFDDPQSPPRFGTMLANLISFCIYLWTQQEPGRIHINRLKDIVRREITERVDGKSVKRTVETTRITWQRQFFNGTSLKDNTTVYVTDVYRAHGLLRHLIKSGVGKDYQDRHYFPKNPADVERGRTLVGNIACLTLWDDDEATATTLQTLLGFVPPIFAIAPAYGRQNTWDRRTLLSGEFAKLMSPDTHSKD